MLTPKAVAEQTFTKAKFGGYTMQEVDTFLDEITKDYTALVEENASLKGKLKVLADKIGEYREIEDVMRATLHNAQKTATEMVEEAESKREAILVALEQDIRARKQEYDNEIALCRAQLAEAQARTASYVAMVKDVTVQHQAFLNSIAIDLSAEETAEAAPAAEEKVEQEDVQPEEETAEAVEETAPAAEEAAPAAEETAPVTTATTRIDFANLKFGKDYEIK
ncbi:MAG: DivIVA domain-containing protein [Oscillospiraceae bacterium]|nr:DivIVA domain-containing protein [Oscillospiraceae bacterium]